MKCKFAFFPFLTLDYKAAQDYLDRKAAQGWVLDDIYPFRIATFVPAEGRRHYVDVGSYAGFGPGPDMIQLCGDAGWEYVAGCDDMVFFRSLPGTEPQPLQSDATFEWKEFCRKQVRHGLICKAVVLLFLLIEPLFFFTEWSQYVLSLFRSALAFPPFLLCLGLMLPQGWRPCYLRSTLSLLFTLVFLILWCVVIYRAATFR